LLILGHGRPCSLCSLQSVSHFIRIMWVECLWVFYNFEYCVALHIWHSCRAFNSRLLYGRSFGTCILCAITLLCGHSFGTCILCAITLLCDHSFGTVYSVQSLFRVAIALAPCTLCIHPSVWPQLWHRVLCAITLLCGHSFGTVYSVQSLFRVAISFDTVYSVQSPFCVAIALAPCALCNHPFVSCWFDSNVAVL
jgi:hypothetical protein